MFGIKIIKMPIAKPKQEFPNIFAKKLKFPELPT